jgi:hypothetical protein
VKEQKARVTVALVFGLAVLSHFFLDVPVHAPDLPLGFDPSSPKLGFGLWNQVDVTLALELGLLVAGGALYAGITVPRVGQEMPTRVLVALLVAIGLATPFLPIPPSPTIAVQEELAALLLLAALAEWMDRSREPLGG